MDTLKTPKTGESLAAYVSRVRKALNLTQFELASCAGIHTRSVGKIERGLTTKLSRKTLQGIAVALGTPVEYLEAVIKGEEVKLVQGVRFCPQCWSPGNAADEAWSNIKAKYCYLCGTQLRSSCSHCGELVVSLRYKFCPLCGKSYK
ncbi:zinc ribbon domain-containing protein [Aetokthonos hydrillicola Thurmond2011]|jgi:transcriptional regulator with XRE-family HTH domain|uniref:Zinc ribbon domain-containing protein n=1 Tax=Aetokthonos hydrillicola Thurmond2011 TaxID=2712845 RepID=A0AAP5M474_9CYAN|nr:zinc ribbon domain-containing protein [Aetokthonos hydrillicola]MBO3464528.1 helix-turn-helix domain-containing protein [Aetokthonos hydrillicola CCALA 1050]MDR9894591.1 zinc ribbon domain-containing protein [Aetokthonos hydrillicola Thurmond2011]